MPDKTKNPTRKASGWSAARRHLATLDKPALLALVKDLYDSGAENRDFIQSPLSGRGWWWRGSRVVSKKDR
jgi:hypothetical protein